MMMASSAVQMDLFLLLEEMQARCVTTHSVVALSPEWD